MTDRAVAIIDLDNIIHNYKIIKSTLRRSCKFMAVVKANAYGHGASTVATVLEQNGVKHFAVATVEEGIALRRAGITGDILILGYTEGDDCINAILSFNLIQAVSSPEYAEHLASYGKVRVHIKLDTGMSRLGLYCHNPSDSVSCADTAEKIYKNPNLSVEGIFTHFSDSDNLDGVFTKMQYEAFIACCDELSKRGISLGIRHCCNSLATLNFPYMQLDMVRIGISLYGHITGETSSKLELKNAIELKSKVIAVKELCENDTVSYSRTFTAHQNIKTAVISIGYADGILRSYSNKMEVIIDNGTERFKAKIRGRICMDLCVAEVTGKECNVGDEVTIFGREICLYDYAKLGDTIVDEIVCALNKRIKRKYIYNGGI